MMKISLTRFRLALLITVLFGSLGIASPAYCWDKFGHEVITQIAYEHLKPNVKAQVDSLIASLAPDPDVTGLDVKYTPYNFVTAGAWMDDIRSISKEFNTWHYIDLPIDNKTITASDVTSFTDTNPNNAVHAINTFCEPNITNPNAPIADRARALAFFLHLAGDLHQPLHCVGIDKGGNTYQIAALVSADPEWKIANLHSFWDNAYRYSGKGGSISVVEPALDLPRITTPGQAPVASFADEIAKQFTPDNNKLISDDNCADWALESKNIAATFVYPALKQSHILTPGYVQKSHDIACQRLVLAGLREAYTLNKWLGDLPAPAPSPLPATAAAPTVPKDNPDQSTVALKTMPETISSTSQDVTAALKPSDKDKAAALVDQTESVVGTLVQVYSPESHTFVALDFDSDYENTITAMARPISYSKLPDLSALEGMQVLVTGKVTSYKGRIEIILTDISQIKIVK